MITKIRKVALNEGIGIGPVYLCAEVSREEADKEIDEGMSRHKADE